MKNLAKGDKIKYLKKLLSLNLFLLFAIFIIVVYFRKVIPVNFVLSVSFFVFLDIVIDILWISNVVKEKLYISYIEYYRKFIFWIIVGFALLVDFNLLKTFFSIRGLFALGLIFFISLIYLTTTHTWLSNYKKYINKEIKTYRYLHYVDSILWLLLFDALGLFNSYILYVFIFRHICMLILEIFKYKGKFSKEKYVANITYANRTTLVLIFFSLIYGLNTIYNSFTELAGIFFLFFIIKIIGVKQPQQIFSERIYTDKEKDKEIKSKYRAKNFPKEHGRVPNNYLVKVLKTGIHYFTFRIDSENIEEILPVLNIPKETKDEIKETVEEGKVIFISEAAFDPKWHWEEKYLIWEEDKNILYKKVGEGEQLVKKVSSLVKHKHRIRDLYRNPGLVLPPDDICVLREYFFNVRALHAPLEKDTVCRVDYNNLMELLPVLRVPKSDKKEIEKLIRENKKNVVIISEAVYTKRWKYDKRYLVFKVNEEDRIKSFSGFRKNRLTIKYAAIPLSFYHNSALISPEKCLQQFTDYKRKFDSLKAYLKSFNILTINRSNASELFPMLYIPSKVKKKIKKLIKENKIVVITEAAFQPEWKWEEKYLVFDEKKTRK